MTIPRGALLLSLLVCFTSEDLSARQSADLVQLGGLRVPSCPRADDPQYGLTKEKAIPIGGGRAYMAARQRNYLATLRGPEGQPVRVNPGVASGPRDVANGDMTIPPGIVEAEPVICVQTFLDAEGRFSRSEYLGGPRSLLPAALEALAKWSARPVRVNGVPIVNPMILQIPLK